MDRLTYSPAKTQVKEKEGNKTNSPEKTSNHDTKTVTPPVIT